MTSPSDKLEDIQAMLAETLDKGGFSILFTNADDFGPRTGERNFFVIIEKRHATIKDEKLHMKMLVPKVNIPFILALVAGDSIEQVARDARGTI
jgi:hypothetical protein